MNEITGTTRVYAIVGDPIHQVKTPQGINRLLRARGADGVLVPMHVDAAGLEALVGGLRRLRNLGGFVVTVPHKTRVAALCDEVSAAAAQTGAVNVVRRSAEGRLVGTILDGEGFVAGLRRAGIDPAGLSVYLAGAGGAANAIAFALAAAGAARLTVANRTAAKAGDLLGRLAAAYPRLAAAAGGSDPSGHDLVVNATSLGLRDGDPLPCDAARLDPRQTVAEIIMQPADTALLVAARARGCRVHPGQPMLDCQLELMADFMGVAPAAA